MYKVAIPVMNWFNNRPVDCEAILTELKRAGATRIWLCPSRGIEVEEELSAQIEALKEHKAFFEANGIEVGAWISSLGHGGILSHEDYSALKRADRYEKIVGLNGTTCDDSFCPSGELFATDYTNWVGRLAETGVRMIMLDDDYRLGIRPCGPGCCCDRHMKEFCERVGETVTREQLPKLIFKGGRNKYRDAWLDMGRDALLGLAKKLRQRVDEIDPSIRMGVCAVMTTWDFEGVSAVELTRALAGNTKPFLRTIGAPYWSANGGHSKLGHTIDYTRMQKQWCDDPEVELFTEGDAYPRPRYSTPASYLEMYDMALRADGCMDGILKYMMDYCSSPRYEKGYIDRMVRNAPAYEWIDRYLAKGVTEGVDVFCRRERLREANIPDEMTMHDLNDAFTRSSAQYLLVDCAVPTACGTKAVHAAFGENGRYISEEQLNDGVVLDMPAARYLMERGVDVGIEAVGECGNNLGLEYYPADDEYVNCGAFRNFCKLTLKDGAQVLSTKDGECACYRYENEKGQRFLVYAFDMDMSWSALGATRSYCRQKQLIRGIEWAGRKKLPAVCLGQPDIYLICKRTEDGLAVGLWNLSHDYLLDPVVELDGDYELVSSYGCQTEAVENGIRLVGDIAPYSFTGLSLKAK